jgi:penicillin amidase
MLRRPPVVTLALITAVPLLVALLVGHVRFWSAQSRLPTRGLSTERLAGCPAPVEILLDGRGVPHVRAGSDNAAWFAEGWLHARERFFQMELARRAAAGRLSELFGEDAIPVDRKMRIWQLDASARRQLALLDGPTRDVLEAYAAGVNAALAEYRRWIAPEVWLLGVDPEPWQVEDSLRIGMLMQLNLTWSMGEELKRAVQISRLGRDRAVDLWGWTPREAKAWIPPLDYATAPRRDDEALTPPLSGEGSNNWAVAPSRTVSGRPIVANDPHIGVSLPTTWYAIHLSSSDLEVAGASVPGAPGVLIGHNEKVAWGFTMTLLDDQDLSVLTLDDNGESELIDGTWQPLRTVTERIEVRWRAEPVLLKIRLSERGPIVRESRREVLALSWTGYYGGSAVGAVVAMDRASTAMDAADAWQDAIGPSMNMVAADVDGHVVHQVVGRLPDRRRGAGRLPAPGSDSRWAWSGLLPFDVNPRTVDPPEGFVATANHDLYGEGDYPSARRLAGDFAPPWRVRRIRHELAASREWTVPETLALQGDVLSLRAIAFLKLLRRDLEDHGGPAADTMMDWDGQMTAASTAPHVFSQFLLDLGRAVGGDEAVRDGLPASPLGPEELLRLLAGGLDESWWDDVRTAGVEDRAAIIGGVLDGLDVGGRPATWGSVHTVVLDHPLRPMPVVGAVLGRLWSRGPLPVGGDNVTVNATYWSRRHPFDVTVIPSMRFIADVGAWDDTVLVLPLGQSGRPWSEHYSDQTSDWWRVRGETLPFSREAVDLASRVRIRLEPEGRSSPEGHRIGPPN